MSLVSLRSVRRAGLSLSHDQIGDYSIEMYILFGKSRISTTRSELVPVPVPSHHRAVRTCSTVPLHVCIRAAFCVGNKCSTTSIRRQISELSLSSSRSSHQQSMRCAASSRDSHLGERDRDSSPLPMQWRIGSSTRTTILGFRRDESIGGAKRAKIFDCRTDIPTTATSERGQDVVRCLRLSCVALKERSPLLGTARGTHAASLLRFRGACSMSLAFALHSKCYEPCLYRHTLHCSSKIVVSWQ